MLRAFSSTHTFGDPLSAPPRQHQSRACMAPVSCPVCSGGDAGASCSPFPSGSSSGLPDWDSPGQDRCRSLPAPGQRCGCGIAGLLPTHSTRLSLTDSQALARHLAPAGIVQRDTVSSFLHGAGGRSRSLQWFDYGLCESCGNLSPLGESPFPALSPQHHCCWRAASLELA